MIIARFDDDDGRLSMVITGHAGSAPAGEDLVCASTSTLASALVQQVMEMREAGQTMGAVRIKLLPGNTKAEFTPTEACYQRALGMLETVETGFLLLESNYPQFVRVIGLHSLSDDD